MYAHFVLFYMYFFMPRLDILCCIFYPNFCATTNEWAQTQETLAYSPIKFIILVLLHFVVFG